MIRAGIVGEIDFMQDENDGGTHESESRQKL